MSKREGCTYCLSMTRPEGVERVISKAIGVFEQNWTLDCVCDDCNSHFSENVNFNPWPSELRNDGRTKVSFQHRRSEFDDPTGEWATLSSLHFVDPQTRQIAVAAKGA